MRSSGIQCRVILVVGNNALLGCHMSLKEHFLHSHLEFFSVIIGAIRDGRGKQFHLNIQAMEAC